MPMTDETGSSPWNIPPISTSTPPVASSSAYHARSDAVAAPRPRRPLTARTSERPDRIEPFVWVGTHGGAGATSLQRSTGSGLDLSQRWPDPALGWSSSVVLVCRSNGAGLDAMGRLLQEWVSRSVPDLRVLAAVVVDDAPSKRSRRVRARVSELRSVAPQVLTLPWIEAWRDNPYTPHPAAGGIADAVRSTLSNDL